MKLPWIKATGRFLLRALKALFISLLIVWSSLAVHFSNLPWPTVRTALGVILFLWSVWAVWISHDRRMHKALGVVFLLVVIWFTSIRPSQDRPWRPEVAVLPRAEVNGDTVKLMNVRNFEFRSRDDFTPRYEERTVSISHLTSVDLFISYWSIGPVGHTFLSFNFDNAPPVSISIETRPEVGESFAPVSSLFKQFELIYIVGDERDLVGVRTHHRNEAVFLYPLRVSRTAAQDLFRVYLKRINQLYERPEWYHLLSNSCTVNIIRYANAIGRTGGWDFRHLLNGWIDRYLFSVGQVASDANIGFHEFRKRSQINDAAKAAKPGQDFSKAIRANLP